MNKYLKYGFFTLVASQLLLLILFIGLPRLTQTLPGEMRVRLARYRIGVVLLEFGTTPMPTALPAPSNELNRTPISIQAIAVSTVTQREQVTPIPLSSTPSIQATEKTNLDTVAMTPPTATPTPTLTPTQEPLPSQVRIEGVSIIPQGFNNCGPANLTINLNFLGNATTQAEAAAFLKPNSDDRNVSPWQMVDYVNEQTNMRAYIASGGDLELLKQLIAAGFLVVIEKGYELPQEGWLGHYLTIFGYDDEAGEMVSMDTNLGPWDGSGRYDTYEDVNFYWQQFNYTFFVVYPPEKEAQLHAILGADMLESANMWQMAAEKAQSEIEQNPENAFAWFNLGTNLTRLGELTGDILYYENGTAAFDQARTLGIPPRIVWYQFRPYIAYMKVGRYQDMLDLAEITLGTQGGRNVEEAYLYKGHALVLTGNGPEAVQAYTQALQLNENFYPAQWALDSIIGNE